MWNRQGVLDWHFIAGAASELTSFFWGGGTLGSVSYLVIGLWQFGDEKQGYFVILDIELRPTKELKQETDEDLNFVHFFAQNGLLRTSSENLTVPSRSLIMFTHFSRKVTQF